MPATLTSTEKLKLVKLLLEKKGPELTAVRFIPDPFGRKQRCVDMTESGIAW